MIKNIFLFIPSPHFSMKTIQKRNFLFSEKVVWKFSKWKFCRFCQCRSLIWFWTRKFSLVIFSPGQVMDWKAIYLITANASISWAENKRLFRNSLAVTGMVGVGFHFFLRKCYSLVPKGCVMQDYSNLHFLTIFFLNIFLFFDVFKQFHLKTVSLQRNF